MNTVSGRLLDAFLALEDAKRFSIAAERCHVTPSALSQMIARLEEQVGAKLFDRDTRNVALTAEGEIFSRAARRAASELTGALDELQGRKDRLVGAISIAGPPSLCGSWLPAQLAEFRKRHPGISLRLHDVYSDDCLSLVTGARVDFGLNARAENKSEIESQLLVNERMYLLCRSDDVLAHRSHIHLRDLVDREVAHILRAGSVWQLMGPLLRSAGVREGGQEVATLATLAGLVANGFGISVIPQSALKQCTRRGISTVPIKDRQVRRPIYLIKRRGRSLSPAAATLWDQLRERSVDGFEE